MKLLGKLTCSLFTATLSDFATKGGRNSLRLGMLTGNPAVGYAALVKNNSSSEEAAVAAEWTEYCQLLANALVIQDQDINNYEDILEDELDQLNADKIAELQRLQQILDRIKELELKEEQGTIEEDEKQELDSLRSSFEQQGNEVDDKFEARLGEIFENGKVELESSKEQVYQAKDIAEVAKNYGELLSNTKVSGSKWKKLMGTTAIAKEKQAAGTFLCKASEDLSNQIKKVESSNNTLKNKVK